MKYSKNKINIQHHHLKEFTGFLNNISEQSWIDRIIPGRISRKQSSSSHQYISFSYFTDSGAKLLLRKGGTVQELFLIFSSEKRDMLGIFIKPYLHSVKK